MERTSKVLVHRVVPVFRQHGKDHSDKLNIKEEDDSCQSLVYIVAENLFSDTTSPFRIGSSLNDIYIYINDKF